MQQVPEELERVMVGVEAYLSIRRHTFDTGLSFFEDDGEVEKTLNEKVYLFCLISCDYSLSSF